MKMTYRIKLRWHDVQLTWHNHCYYGIGIMMAGTVTVIMVASKTNLRNQRVVVTLMYIWRI